MTLGRVKASARKMAFGVVFLISPISHSHIANGLVCGLSTRKMRTPCWIQNSKMLLISSHNARQTPVSKLNG